MKITELKIESFGGLESFELAPSKGINVISGDNEAGKSTVGAFIRYALYGLSGRGKEVYGNEKLKFSPWNGKPPCGSIEVKTEDGREYRITRRSGAAADYEVTTLTGERVPCAEEPGQMLLGIDRLAFDKSVFVGQSDISGDRLSGLSNAVRELLFSGEGDAAADDVKKKLTSEKNLIYNPLRKTGTIFELEEKKKELAEKSEKYIAAHKDLLASEFKLDRIKQTFEENEKKKARLEAQLRNIEADKAKKRLSELERLSDKVGERRDAVRKAETEASYNGFFPDEDYIKEVRNAYYTFKTASESSENADKTLAAARSRYDEDAKKYGYVTRLERLLQSRGERLDENSCGNILAKAKDLQNAAASAHRKATFSIALFFLIVTVPLYFYFKSKESGLIGELRLLCDRYGCSDVTELERTLAVYPAVCEFNRSAIRQINDAENEADRRKKAYERAADELAGLAARLGRRIEPMSEGFEGDFASFIAETEITFEALERVREEYRSAREKYLAFAEMQDIDELEKKASEYCDDMPLEPEDTVRRNLGFVSEANKLLANQISELERNTGILTGSIPNPTAIASETAFVEKRLAEETEKRNALLMAIEAVDKACENVRTGAFPELGRRAGELFCLMTDGKYDALTVSGEDSRIEVREKGSALFRSADYLSAGALDAAYIAVRLAFADCFCSEKPPIVFDDSFSRLDDKRLENILRILCKLSDEYQIFILTCHGREEGILNKVKGEKTDISAVNVSRFAKPTAANRKNV